MFTLLLSNAALAGDLTVSTPWPVNVYVDGAYRPYNPGTLTVGLGQLAAGQHRVDIADGNNAVLGSTMVSVPTVGLAALVYDGTFWMQPTAAAPVMMVQAPTFAAQPAAPAPEPVQQGPVAMDEAAFGRLLAQVRQASFADDKVAVVRAGCGRNHLTISQLTRLVKGMSFADDQLAAVDACAAKVVDPENAFELRGAFSFPSDVERALAHF
jgi:hypothetical protein